MKEIFVASALAAGLSSAGTYTATQYSQPPPTSQVDLAPLSNDLRALNANVAKLLEVQSNVAQVDIAYQHLSEQHAVMLETKAQEIICLIKGCRPQAMAVKP